MATPMSQHQPCPLLTKLPSELRIRIYEDVLRFDNPIKLRQHVPGSESTTILRCNRQIYHEALAVLYDVNIVSVSRNDFCAKTTSALQTPILAQHVKHLRFTRFSESIACNFLLDRCSVCQSDAKGLVELLEHGMPMLKSVTIDYSTQINAFLQFKDLVSQGGTNTTVDCINIGVYRVRADRLDDLDFTFRHRPLASCWPAIVRLSSMDISQQEKDERLVPLRAADPDVPDKLWLLFCADKYGQLGQLCNDNTVEAWRTEPWLSGSHDEQRSNTLHELTLAVQHFMKTHTAVQCRRYLTSQIAEVFG
ncbi:hypothetical protein LTR10_007293 [Elasticomyces elasticus]|nr:hypothetical protein LTR10_007293 [Elasticomyces elasticus]KAK4979105.1 hypothetical protein LTR42_001607 [Elasticomyces elasticus]